MKCDRCGLESDVEEAFQKTRSMFFDQRAYCPDCALVRQRDQVLIYYFAMPLFGGLLYWAVPGMWLGEFLLRVSLIFVISIPLIVAHELSHMLAAQAVRFRVFGIHIGVGRTLLRFTVRGLPWEIHALPLGGMTLVGSGPTSFYRLKLLLVFAAGPFVHLVLVGIAVLWLRANYWMVVLFPLLFEVLQAFILANAVTFLVNIWPMRAKNLPGAPGTDGWNLFRLPFVKEAEIRERQSGYYATEALYSYRANETGAARQFVDRAMDIHPESLVALNVLGMVQMQVEDFPGSRATFLSMLDRPDLPKMFRFVALNNVAYANLLLDDPSLLAQADEFSKEAHEHMPWVPAIVGTRGAVLVALGRFDEGIPLLKKALSGQTEKQDIAADSYHLAIAEAARGDLETARKHFDLAARLDDRSFLKKRAQLALKMTVA